MSSTPKRPGEKVDDADVDEALEESFPASDPPSYTTPRDGDRGEREGDADKGGEERGPSGEEIAERGGRSAESAARVGKPVP